MLVPVIKRAFFIKPLSLFTFTLLRYIVIKIGIRIISLFATQAHLKTALYSFAFLYLINETVPFCTFGSFLFLLSYYLHKVIIHLPIKNTGFIPSFTSMCYML